MSGPTCPECGARLTEGADRCDLCGSPIVNRISPDQTRHPDVAEPAANTEAYPQTGVYCNDCGWKNPVGANYCSRCGAKLQDDVGDKPTQGVTALDRPLSAQKPHRRVDGQTETSGASGNVDLTRYVGILVGLSVLVVVALYMITVVSKQDVAAPTEAAVEAPARVRSAAVIDESEAIPVADRYAPTLDSLRTSITGAEGADRLQNHRNLVDFFLRIGRIDRAAIEQQRLAMITGDVSDWKRAGNLLFDWMESASSERKTDVALLTIDAYERVLKENPNDLDVRADLGWAYQYDPQNPMQAIQNTNRVLKDDPNHLAANYNRGVFLLRINRVSEAIAQFEKVKGLARPESPYYRQSDALIRTVRREQDVQGSI